MPAQSENFLALEENSVSATFHDQGWLFHLYWTMFGSPHAAEHLCEMDEKVNAFSLSSAQSYKKIRNLWSPSSEIITELNI
ncbi:unnamed protein product [Nippostrongylus brasiliensis]|uniref:Uncharacterized protein n=1 Tax=Nippostrongylus brasiliensis TaxID=27835 RepID=A0A0N4XL85_NIPBR|nr:unnamed protein product [Nippostrongylus brasiliensis]